MNIVIVGGSTGGAMCAAQLRRLSESAHIMVIEKTEYVSTAYCGLAYGLGGVVQDSNALVPLTPAGLSERFNVSVKVGQTVTKINRNDKTVAVRDVQTSQISVVSYDKLIIATGASAHVPLVPGCALPGVYTLRTVGDLQKILAAFKLKTPQRAVVVGGGFIGLEVVENLRHRNIACTLIEATPQVMGHVDYEMAELVRQELLVNEVTVHLETSLVAIEQIADGLRVETSDDALITDIVILAIGTRANTELALQANLEIGKLGGMVVDEYMRTIDHDIYAIGDVVQTQSALGPIDMVVQLAGVLSHQVKVATTHIVGKPAIHARGVLGTFVCKVFDLTVAATGLTEKRLKMENLPYRKVYLPTVNHAFFYPGVEQMMVKIVVSPGDGRLLGAQIVGGEGSDKRMDVLATAIAGGLTAQDLEWLELAYAPPFGMPRDPVNLIGSVAAALMENSGEFICADELVAAREKGAIVIDCRTQDEFVASAIPGAIHISASAIRDEISSLEKDRDYIVYCQIGSKATSVQRIFKQRGYRCLNLMGGYVVWNMFYGRDKDKGSVRNIDQSILDNKEVPRQGLLDLRGLRCPGPLVSIGKHIDALDSGAMVVVLADDPAFARDVRLWCNKKGHIVGEQRHEGRVSRTSIYKRPRKVDLGRNTVFQSSHSSTRCHEAGKD